MRKPRTKDHRLRITVERRLPSRARGPRERVFAATHARWPSELEFQTGPGPELASLIGAFARALDFSPYPPTLEDAGWDEVSSAQARAVALHRLRYSAAYTIEQRDFDEARTIVDALWARVPGPRRFVVNTDLYEQLTQLGERPAQGARSGCAYGVGLTEHTFETCVVILGHRHLAAFLAVDED